MATLNYTPDSQSLQERLCLALWVRWRQLYVPPSWETLVRQAAEVEAELASQELILNPDAQPPIDKLKLLCEYIPKFAATWQRQRSDWLDQSQSSYDYSIAIWCFRAGFTPAEVASTIIAHRRIWGQDLDKVCQRRDYLERTLARAEAAAREVK